MAFKNVSTTRPMGKSALRNVELRKQMALMLQKEGMEPLPSGNMAGRVFAPTTALQGLGKVANVGVGVLGQYLAGKRGQEIDDDRSQDRIDRVGAYLSDMKNTPEVAEQGNPNEIFTGPQYSQGTPEVHAVPPQGISPNASSSRAPLDNSIRLSYGKMDDHNPYVPASEYQPATQGGELIGGNTHVPAQPAIAGLSSQDSAMKNLFTSDNPEMQELAMKMITGTGGRGIREKDVFDWYSGLTEDQKNTADRQRRGGDIKSFGDYIQRVSGSGNPIGTRIPINLKPGEKPDHIEAKALADTEGKTRGNFLAKFKGENFDREDMSDISSEVRAILETGDPTGSALGAEYDRAKALVGLSDPNSQANVTLRMYASMMVAKVPRSKGSQSDAEFLDYKRAIGDVGNAAVPVEDRLVAVINLERLGNIIIKRNNERIAKLNKKSSPANANAGNQPSPSNGETIEYVRDPKTNKLVRAR
jgi:hypothetical protein